MRPQKVLLTILCLMTILGLSALPARAMTIREGLKVIVQAEDNIVDAAYQEGFEILHMEIDQIQMGDSYTLTRNLTAGTGYEVYGVGVGITSLTIRVNGPDKKVVAENSGEQPDVRFAAAADGDYDITIICNKLNSSNSPDSTYYFFFALATQPK